MSEKPKIRVQVGEMVQGAPYRIMRDASPELQKEYGALLESTRKKVANVTNAASLAAGLLAVDAATNWGPGLAQAFGALLATALIVIPQRIKHKNKKELAALRHYQETVSVHVDNAAEEVDPALNVKQLRVLSNLNEADHGSTYEWEAGVAGFIAVLKFLSFWDEMKQPGKELEVCCIALVTALLALAAAALTRKALRDEQKRFRNEMQKFLRRIPGNTRVAYDVGMGEGHELEVERKAAEKGRK